MKQSILPFPTRLTNNIAHLIGLCCFVRPDYVHYLTYYWIKHAIDSPFRPSPDQAVGKLIRTLALSPRTACDFTFSPSGHGYVVSFLKSPDCSFGVTESFLRDNSFVCLLYSFTLLLREDAFSAAFAKNQIGNPLGQLIVSEFRGASHMKPYFDAPYLILHICYHYSQLLHTFFGEHTYLTSTQRNELLSRLCHPLSAMFQQLMQEETISERDKKFYGYFSQFFQATDIDALKKNLEGPLNRLYSEKIIYYNRKRAEIVKSIKDSTLRPSS